MCVRRGFPSQVWLPHVFSQFLRKKKKWPPRPLGPSCLGRIWPEIGIQCSLVTWLEMLQYYLTNFLIVKPSSKKNHPAIGVSPFVETPIYFHQNSACEFQLGPKLDKGCRLRKARGLRDFVLDAGAWSFLMWDLAGISCGITIIVHNVIHDINLYIYIYIV